MVRPGSLGLAALACACALTSVRHVHAAPPTAEFPTEPAPAAASVPAPVPTPAPAPIPASAPTQGEAAPSEPAPTTPGTDTTGEQRAKRRAIHQKVLSIYVDGWLRQRDFQEGFGYAGVVLNGLGLGVGAAIWNEDRPFGITYVVGYGAATAAFGLSLLAERDTRVDELEVLFTSGAGISALGFAVADDPGNIPRLSTASAAGAYFTVALLQGINSLVRKTRPSTLRARRDQLSQPRLDEREFRTTERAFLDTDVPIRHGVLAAPLALGAGIAFIPVIDGHHSSDEATAAGVVTALLGLTAITMALGPNLVPSYRDLVNRTGLSISASPTRFDLRYRF